MRPIDTIRNKMDSDLIKYHSSNLCKIDKDSDVFNLEGIGVCALVRLFNEQEEPGKVDANVDTYFPVLIVNRTYGYIETNIASKYYVLVLNLVEDRAASLCMGMLISQTTLGDNAGTISKKEDLTIESY